MSGRVNNKVRNKRPPYWLPATSYYFLVFALAATTFFLVILIFHDGGNEVEFVTAGLAASVVLIIGVLVREVVFRNARERHFAKREMLDRNLRSVPIQTGEFPLSKKFTLEQNEIALDTIKKRSEAAKVFARIAAGHREVFELCEEYRKIVSAEIPNTHPGSPRLKAMMKGKRQAAKVQEYHLLKWAEIESNEFAQRAAQAENNKDRSLYLQKARGSIDLALRYYPENEQLRASELFLENLSGEEGSVERTDSVDLE